MVGKMKNEGDFIDLLESPKICLHSPKYVCIHHIRYTYMLTITNNNDSYMLYLVPILDN